MTDISAKGPEYLLQCGRALSLSHLIASIISHETYVWSTDNETALTLSFDQGSPKYKMIFNMTERIPET